MELPLLFLALGFFQLDPASLLGPALGAALGAAATGLVSYGALRQALRMLADRMDRADERQDRFEVRLTQNSIRLAELKGALQGKAAAHGAD